MWYYLQHWAQWDVVLSSTLGTVRCDTIFNTEDSENVVLSSALRTVKMWYYLQHWGQWKCGTMFCTGDSENVVLSLALGTVRCGTIFNTEDSKDVVLSSALGTVRCGTIFSTEDSENVVLSSALRTVKMWYYLQHALLKRTQSKDIRCCENRKCANISICRFWVVLLSMSLSLKYLRWMFYECLRNWTASGGCSVNVYAMLCFLVNVLSMFMQM